MLYAVYALCLHVLGLYALYTRQWNMIVCTTDYTDLTSVDIVQSAALFNCVGTYMSQL